MGTISGDKFDRFNTKNGFIMYGYCLYFDTDLCFPMLLRILESITEVALFRIKTKVN